MTEEKSLISFAIISTEWHEEKKDYLDMFIPFCLQCLEDQRSSNAIVSIKRLKLSLTDKFGIQLPSNVIEMIVRRLSAQGYIRIERKVCYLSDKKIDRRAFEEKSSIAEAHQKELFKRISKYLEEEHPSFDFDKGVLEDSFIQYLSKYGRGVVASKSSEIETDNVTEELYNYYIGVFISYVKENDEKYYSYVKEIIYGAMYASALHMQHNLKRMQTNSRIENLKVFLDTPLLLHALGYSGEELKESVIELITILKNLGVKICYWKHNLDELISILEAYEQHYVNGTLDKSRNFEYLVLQKTTPADISRYKATLPLDLKNNDIIVHENPALQREELVECNSFEEYIKENMYYRSDTRRVNDINSICFIYHLRTRQNFKRIENCEAIFVTQNHTLASLTKKYFKDNRSSDEYPAIIDDTLLTSIAWIKSETDGDKILNSKIIADAWAAQNVPAMFWEKCVQEMEELQKHGEISQEQVYLLEYDFLARRQLYERAEGDVAKLNMGDIEQVLQQIEYNKHQELLDENERLKREEEETKSENVDLNQRLLESKVNEYTRSLGIWTILATFRKGLLLIICCILVGISQVISFVQSQHSSLMLGAIAILISVGVKYVDKLLSAKRNTFSSYLHEKSKTLLRRKIAKKEDYLVEEIVEAIVNRSRWFR